MTTFTTKTLLHLSGAACIAAAIAISGCEPKSTTQSSGVSLTPAETPQETPVVKVPDISETVETATYRGRTEFFDESGEIIDSIGHLPNPVLDQMRALKTDAAIGASLNAAVAQAVSEKGQDLPAIVMTYSEIAGLSEKYTNLNEAPALHSGLITVRYGDTIFGVASEVVYNEAREGYDMRVEPWGFEASDIEIVSNRNVRTDPNDIAPQAPLLGEWVDGVYQIKNTRGKDGAYQFALIKAKHAASGKTFTFYGPDNFQTYR